MPEIAPLLTIALAVDGEKTTIVMRHQGPVNNRMQYALRSEDGQLSARGLPSQDWECLASEDGLTMTRELSGPWALDTAISWAGMLQDRVGVMKAIMEDAPYKDLPPYPTQLSLDGVVCPTHEDLEKEAQKQPLVTYPLGTFELSQPKLHVSDPCYQISSWCARQLEVKPGRWVAQTLVGPTEWHVRNHMLQVHHESLGDIGIQPISDLKKTDIHAGVDSGQCGFFDYAEYPLIDSQFEWKNDTFYAKCCNSTLSRELPGGAVIDNYGVVTSSGFGDGGYSVYVKHNKQGEVVLALLVFISNSEDDEDEGEAAAVAEADKG